ncbi:MAG: O-antigen ligase family protein [Verrucomicrobiales bacterium]|nr:O-antigen ligase family protein [Verrucomicrobiales bacterium]
MIGHDLKFAALFLILYYIRPQDWVPGLAGFNIIRPLMIGWFMVLASQGSRSPVRGWFRTPHDWAVLIFSVFIVWAAPPGVEVLSPVFSLAVFYFLTCHALSTWDAVLIYLKIWNGCLVTLAAFGVLQTLGFDITAGRSYTDFFMGRLSLGTWMANNPNALAHTVVMGIPLSYVLYFWRGSAAGRTIVFPFCAILIGWCAWMTESKGAFLVGAGITVLIFVVGRPRWIQIAAIATALTLGVGALSFLPRMEQMSNLRSDEGVQGRLMAWTLAKGAMDYNTFGVGWKQFIAIFPWREGTRVVTVVKATHSSYVQVGADLGIYGLALWLLVLWLAIRSVAIFKGWSDQEERCRRAIILLLVAYLASGWMINRQYYSEYFLIAAAAAAVHRLNLSGRNLGWNDAVGQPESERILPPNSRKAISWSRETGFTSLSATVTEKKMWNRVGWIDLLMTLSLTKLVVYIWDYILINL